MTTLVTLGFGIRVGGHDTGITYPTVHDAEEGADRLFAHGYKQIEIFRRMTELARLKSATAAA